MMMTYREALQAQLAAMQQVYDNAESLRDLATPQDVTLLNFFRHQLPSLWQVFEVIDNRIVDAEALQEVRGNYHINTATQVA